MPLDSTDDSDDGEALQDRLSDEEAEALREQFEDAVEDALSEADFLTREDAEEVVDEHLEGLDVLEEPDEDEESEYAEETSHNGNVEEILDQLPDDLADRVKDHLTEPENDDMAEKSALGTAVDAVQGRDTPIPTSDGADSPEFVEGEVAKNAAEEGMTAAQRQIYKDNPNIGGDS